jgi:hypothetical protein
MMEMRRKNETKRKHDKVRYSAQPERWNMRTVLGIATTLGPSSFILLYIEKVFFN